MTDHDTVAALRTRIAAFERTGKPAYLLEESALRAAQAVIAAAAPNAEALAQAGHLFLLRWGVLGPGLGAADLVAAVNAFRLLGDQDLHLVPEELWPVVWVFSRQFRADAADDRARARGIAVELCQLGEGAESLMVLFYFVVAMVVIVGIWAVVGHVRRWCERRSAAKQEQRIQAHGAVPVVMQTTKRSVSSSIFDRPPLSTCR